MELHIRETLEDLAERLHLHRGAGEDTARVVYEDVQASLEDEQHDGLPDRLARHAVEIENDHPELAAVIRRAADALGAGGL